MFGAEIAVGYLCAYLVRKARRAGGAVDGEVDRVVDAGMERVHDLVTRALGDDPALVLAARQAGGVDGANGGDGEVSERTRARLTGAVEEAVESDAELARALAEAVAALEAALKAALEAGVRAAPGGVVSGNTFHGPTAFQVGQHNRQDNRFGS
ncbi:hypothetical protein [Streptomyces sp. NBC_01190]|uniref:hypothetical protein n=1 Tax=Streptomyces sp. NBC_01190 TaxID=2903767 RepID=UPI00386BEEE5|nr:hypothetical protein OG519_17285 [Streptomyces sp. NBC_01190]